MCVPGHSPEHQPAMTGWFRGLVPVCHADLTGNHGPVAGLGSGVPGNPGAALEFVLPARAPVRFRRARVTVSRGDEEKDCAAISQRLLHRLKVAVRAAKQDARSVHFRLDRARSSMHTEISQAWLRALNSRRIRAGLAARKDNGSWRTFFMMTRVVMTASRPAPGRAAGPGIRDDVAAQCGSR